MGGYGVDCRRKGRGEVSLSLEVVLFDKRPRRTSRGGLELFTRGVVPGGGGDGILFFVREVEGQDRFAQGREKWTSSNVTKRRTDKTALSKKKKENQRPVVRRLIGTVNGAEKIRLISGRDEGKRNF